MRRHLPPTESSSNGAKSSDGTQSSDRTKRSGVSSFFRALLASRGLRLANGLCGVGIVASLAPAAGDTDVLRIALVIVLLILCLGCHEAAHAWAALRCGDTTARDQGRLTLNPIVHIDPIWTVVVPIVTTMVGYTFGGAKPVPVDIHRLRHPLRDMSLVAIAGPLSNLLLAFLFAFLWKFFVETGLYNGAAETPYMRRLDLLPQVMRDAVFFNILLAVFNMMPVPPLDGSRVMTWLLPASLRDAYNAIGGFGLIVVFLLMRVPAVNGFVVESVAAVYRLVNGVISSIW